MRCDSCWHMWLALWHQECLPADAMPLESDPWQCPACTDSTRHVGCIGNPRQPTVRGSNQQAPGAQALADGGHEGAGGGGQGCAAASGALPVITRRKRTADLSVCAHAAEPRGRERPPTDCGGASALQRPSQRVCGLQRDQTSKDVPCALVARPRRGRGARAAPAARGSYDKGAARARCCARSSTHAPECVPL